MRLISPILLWKLESQELTAPSSSNGGQQSVSDGLTRRGKAKKLGSPTPKRELSAALSASLRTELLREIEDLSAPDDAALWAHRKLPAKNQLSEADAQRVEEAFAAKLASIHPAEPGHDRLSEKTGILDIDKSVLAFPEPRRIRDREHIRHVIKQACLICGRRPSDPHHLRFAQPLALSRKASDEFTVPLCRAHHREIHRCGNEGSWWRNTKIDPLAAARALWLETHPLPRGEGTATANELTGAIHGTDMGQE